MALVVAHLQNLDWDHLMLLLVKRIARDDVDLLDQLEERNML